MVVSFLYNLIIHCRLSREYNKLYRAAGNDVETFLSNPVNAFLLVKRLTADWKVAEHLIDASYGRGNCYNYSVI